MADEVVLARFQADLSDLQKELDKYVKGLERVQEEEKDTQKQTTQTAKTEQEAAKKRNAALKSELSELAKLKAARKQAFTPEAIDNFNKKISETQSRIASLRGSTTSLGSSIKSSLGGVAAGIAAAFSVQAVIQFGKASIDAFLEAEENANRLRFAVMEIGNASEEAFNRLIAQSEQLQKTTIFSDDSIQNAQTILATVGLTATQIEEAIPIIADFAAATKQDIGSAAQAFTGGLQGMGREFKRFNVQVSANQTVLENYDALIKGLATTEGAAAEATQTLTGQLKQQENAADELQETIGEKLAPVFVKAKTAIFEAVLGLLGFNKALEAIKQNNIDATANNFEKAAAKIKKSGGDVVQVFEERKKAIEESNAGTLANIAELEKVLGSRQTSQLQKNLAREQIEANEEIIRQNEIKIRQIVDIISREKELTDQQSRTLTADQLRGKSIKELNALLESNALINDSVAQSNISLINKEIEARKKQTEELEKEAAKQLEALKKLYGDVQKIPPIELKVKIKRDGEQEDLAVNSDLIPEKLELPKPDATEFNDGIKDAFDKTVAGWLEANEEILSTTQSLIGELNNLFDIFANARIERIEKDLETQLEVFDKTEEANKDALKKRRVSEKEFLEAQKENEAARVEAEKQAEKKINDIKRRQFNLDKAAALSEIAIETAKNIAAATNPALIALYAALGAVQAGVVLAQPNPYKTGTKDSKEGLAIVGEEGPEHMLLPRGTKILDSKKSKKYADVFDAMYDDNLEGFIKQRFVEPELKRQKIDIDDFVMRTDITPILIKSKEKKDQTTQKSLAENITKSMVINNMTNGKTDFFLERMAKHGIIIKNVDDFKDNSKQSYKRK